MPPIINTIIVKIITKRKLFLKEAIELSNCKIKLSIYKLSISNKGLIILVV